MKTVSEWVEKASIFCGNPVKQVLTKIDSAAPAHPATCCNSMLRSCYRSVGRNASAAVQARTSVCLRSSARPISVAAAALRNGPLATRRTGPSLLRKKTSGEFRMCLSTLTDEQLRRKMDTFNDLFVTVGRSVRSLVNSASSVCWCGGTAALSSTSRGVGTGVERESIRSG